MEQQPKIQNKNNLNKKPVVPFSFQKKIEICPFSFQKKLKFVFSFVLHPNVEVEENEEVVVDAFFNCFSNSRIFNS